MQQGTLLYIILAIIIAFGIAYFQYMHKEKKTKAYLYTGLRFITIFFILLLIINPKLEKNTFFNEKPNLVIAIDNSESVKHLKFDSVVRDKIEVFKNDKALNEKFDIQYYAFGKTLNKTDSILFNDSQTNIATVFNDLSQIYRGEVAPTVVITDGNQTYGTDYEITSLRYNQPIYPVILGDTITYSDLKIQQLNVNKYAYLDNKFPIEIITVYNGNANVNSQLLITSNGVTVYRENLTFSKTQNSKTINITLPANTVGVTSYIAQIVPLASEKNKINNSKPFAVEVIDEQTNVAIVSSIIHPDLGALKKAIESNKQRGVSILKPNEFLEQKDNFQLVILYQPNSAFKAVFDALAQSGDNKFIITGNQTQWSFLNNIQDNYTQEITRQAEDFLPTLNSNFSTFIVDGLDFDSYPPLISEFGEITFNTPFETLLYKRVNNSVLGEPLLSTFESSGKREAILFGENIWKWRVQSYLNERSFQLFDNFIGKLIQYLASNKKRNRLNLNYESFYNGNGNIKITAQFFNKNYEFDTKANLSIFLKDINSGNERTIPFVLKQNNYEVDLSGLTPSEYNFTVKANGSEVTQSGRLRVLDYNVEQQFLNANVTKLEAIATNSEGASYFSNNTSELSNDLINDSRFVTLQKSTKNVVPLIDFKFLLALIALSLATEWFLRKYNGLI
ncbi:VWA domain-containing protein [Flavobacteriaceae bacterium AU392]|nr:VWA domain-containing protein [Flavobacteriaceae bacterium]RKM85547.1 VWA domain-containing protein [Flavobacteriaceae bacterium AU392]